MQKYKKVGTGRKATLPETARYGRTVPLAEILADVLVGLAPASTDVKPTKPRKLRPTFPAPSRRRQRSQV